VDESSCSIGGEESLEPGGSDGTWRRRRKGEMFSIVVWFVLWTDGWVSVYTDEIPDGGNGVGPRAE
jgi:hypothetical protein